MKTIGEKIRALREAQGMSQIELAEKIGVTNRTIHTYECLGAIPRGKNIVKLCEVFHVSRAYLANPEIEDPSYGLEEAKYIEAVREKYGNKGASDVESMIHDSQMFFAGGDVPQEDKDKFFEAVVEAYMYCKKGAHDKFTPNKYK